MMAGDGKVPNAQYSATLGISVAGAPCDIWPWIVQMGFRRGGLYSYDWLDRLFGYLDEPSAERLLPECQDLKVGDEIPMGRGAGFPVTALQPLRHLVMSGRENDFEWSWELSLVPGGDGKPTRLLSRNRAALPGTLRSRLVMLVLEPAAFLMTRRMLLGLKRRGEALAVARAERARGIYRLAS